MSIDNLSIIVPFFNGHKYLSRLLDSLPDDLPVHIIDDLSDDPINVNALHTYPSYRIITRLKEKGYFSGAVNVGLCSCQSDVLILNQDVWFVDEKWLDLIHKNRSRYAMIGERVRGENPAWPNGYIHGTFLYARRDAIDKVGLLDEKRYPLWGSTALWQLQFCRAGYEVFPVQVVPGFHHERKIDQRYGSSIQTILEREPGNIPKFTQVPPLLSVVIPTYNHGKYLADAIGSLIGGETVLGTFPAQTFPDFEVIIVDDGSTDDTPAICRDLCDPFRGVRYTRMSNSGTAAAYNRGIEMAAGKYITTMSADDMRESWSLEELVNTLEKNLHSLVYDELTVFRYGKRIGPWLDPWPKYDFLSLLDENTVPTGTIFTKAAWREVGGYPERLNRGREDWGFALAMGRLGYCGVKIPKQGYLYRRDGQNRTMQNTSPEWRHYFRTQMAILFPDLYSGRFPMACCGKGGARNVVNPGARIMTSPTQFSGASGMVLVEYVGKNSGSQQWGGPKLPSHNIYVFGDNERDKIKLVDARDTTWFFSKRDSLGNSLFRKYIAPEEKSSANSTEHTPEQIPQAEEVAVSMEIGGESWPNDPSEVREENQVTAEILTGDGAINPSMVDEMTIKQVLALTLTPDQWRLVYEHERTNKGRKTLLTILEEKIGM